MKQLILIAALISTSAFAGEMKATPALCGSMSIVAQDQQSLRQSGKDDYSSLQKYLETSESRTDAAIQTGTISRDFRGPMLQIEKYLATKIYLLPISSSPESVRDFVTQSCLLNPPIFQTE